MKYSGEEEDLRGSRVLQGFKNEDLPLAFVFPMFAVIRVDCQFEPFSVFCFLHIKVKNLSQEKKKLILLLISTQSVLQC